MRKGVKMAIALMVKKRARCLEIKILVLSSLNPNAGCVCISNTSVKKHSVHFIGIRSNELKKSFYINDFYEIFIDHNDTLSFELRVGTSRTENRA